MPRNQRPLRYTFPYQLHPNFTGRKYAREVLSGVHPQITRSSSSITALPTASAAQVSQIRTPAGYMIEMYQSTAQTLQPVSHATKGLVLDGDQVDDESAEYVIGGNYTTNPYAMVVGTDSDFFFRATLEITDASGSDQLLVGWRLVQTYQVPVSFLTTGDAGYTDFAAIGFCATKANPNPVGTATDLNNAGSTIASPITFTWADTLTHQLEVRVVGGKAVYLINGVRLGGVVAFDGNGAAITAQTTIASPSFTFDSGDTLVPFIFVRQDADLLDACYLKSFEVGHLVDIGLDPNNE